MPSFYEFFAGGGMARAGLGAGWDCLFANDIDAKKGAGYASNWGSGRLLVKDVGQLTTADTPGHADLAWASFPCQDLSLAGGYAGLKGARSGTFWLFWRLMQALADEGRAPSVVVLENVCGALTSHEGKDFTALGAALAQNGYRFGALVMDAVRFLPHSRPRLFIVAVRENRAIPTTSIRPQPDPLWHPANLVTAFKKLPPELKAFWCWWALPAPSPPKSNFADLLEPQAGNLAWHSPAETQRLLVMMSPLNLRKVEQAQKIGQPAVGGVYRRTRVDRLGNRAQRAEVRFDGVAGCLRTPAGGSSRQSLLFVHGDELRSRLLAPREAARLMGLPDSYKLPDNYNEAYCLVADGVAPPVVRFLAANLLELLLAGPFPSLTHCRDRPHERNAGPA